MCAPLPGSFSWNLWHNPAATVFASCCAVGWAGEGVLGLSQSPLTAPLPQAVPRQHRLPKNPSGPQSPCPSSYDPSPATVALGFCRPVHGSSCLLVCLGFSEHTNWAGPFSSLSFSQQNPAQNPSSHSHPGPHAPRMSVSVGRT